MKSQWIAASVMMALAAGLLGAPVSYAKPADLPSQNGIECPDGSDDPMPRQFSIELDITSKGITLKLGASAAKPELPTSIDTFSPAMLDACFDQLFKYVGDSLMTALRRQADTQRAAQARNLVEMRLFEPVNVRIKDVPLKQALKNLATAGGVRIVLDDAALNEARINLNQPVSLAVENTSVHTALQQLIKPMRLTFEVEKDVVKVTTPENAAREPADRAAARKADMAQRLFEMAERHRRAGELDLAHRLYQQVHLLTPTTLHGRMAILRIADVEDRLRDAAEEQGNPGRSDDDPEQVFRDMRERTVPLGLVNVSY